MLYNNKNIIIKLITIESNTGTDRVINQLYNLLRRNYKVEKIVPSDNINMPLWLNSIIKKLPGKRLIYLLIKEYQIYFDAMNNDKKTIVISFVYPLFGFFSILNKFTNKYEYWYWIPDLIYKKKYSINLRWKMFSIFSDIGIKVCNKILVPSSSAQLDFLTFYSKKYYKKIERLDGIIDTNYLDKIAPKKIDELFEKKYIFHPAGTKPNKNTKLAIEAFLEIDFKIDLIFVYIENSINSEKNKRYNLNDEKVIQLKDIDDSEMKWLYENCLFVSVVSIEEGIGLPILESMYYNKIVVTSQISAMPETSGLNTIFVDPFSKASIMRGYNYAYNIEKNGQINNRIHIYGDCLENQIERLLKVK